MQPYDVLEDDTRDWNKAQKKLLTQSFAARLQQQLQQHHEQVDWNLVSSLSRSPRGIPVPITLTDASVEQILAAAPRVQNVVPQGSTWNGKTDLPMDEATFKQMVSEIEPDSGAPAPSSAPAPSPANATKAPVHSAPKTGS